MELGFFDRERLLLKRFCKFAKIQLIERVGIWLKFLLLELSGFGL